MAEKNDDIKQMLKTEINNFMRKHHIGIGDSKFAMMLREIADEVDD